MSHYYRFNPTVIEQSNPYRCWAASLSCWLDCIYRAKGKITTGTWSGENAKTFKTLDGNPWSRQTQSQDEIVDQYRPDLTENGGLKKEGLISIYQSVGMEPLIISPSKLTYDLVMKKLRERSHLYIAYYSHTMYHAVVGYGVSTTDGIAVMDPWDGGQLIHRKLEFFTEPGRVGYDMFIGCTLK